MVWKLCKKCIFENEFDSPESRETIKGIKKTKSNMIKIMRN